MTLTRIKIKFPEIETIKATIYVSNRANRGQSTLRGHITLVTQSIDSATTDGSARRAALRSVQIALTGLPG